MYLIGITGLIGSGKTTVGNILKKMGYVVFDMDVWCRKMYFDTAFLKVIKESFPYSFQNNIFNKKILRKRVFEDKKELNKLENLTHPYLIKKLKKIIHKNKFSNNIFFIETALLYQMKLDKFCSNVICTVAPFDVMEKRVIFRDNISKKEYDNIISKQIIYENFNQKSDFKLDTNTSFGIIQKNLIYILKEIEHC